MHTVLKALAVVSVLSGTVALAHAQTSEAPDPATQSEGGMMEHGDMMGMMKMMSMMMESHGSGDAPGADSKG